MAGEFNIHFSIIAQDGFSAPMKDAENSSDNFSSKHKKNIQNIKDSNNVASKSFSSLKNNILGLVGAYLSFQGAKKALTDFSHIDKYSKKLQAITHSTDAQMKKMNNDIRISAKETGAVLEEQLQGALELATAGISPDKMDPFLRAITDVKLLAKEDLGVPDIAKMMAVWKANFPNDEAKEMSDSIAFMLDKVPNISFRELQNSLGKSASLGKQMGFSAKELLAVQSKDIVNLGGAVSSTKMKRFLQQIMKQREVLSKQFNIKPDTGLIDTIKLIDQGLNKMNPRKKAKEMKRIFGGGETQFTFQQYVKNLENISGLYNNLQTSADGFAEKSAAIIKPTQNLKRIASTNALIFTNIGEILNKWKIPDAILYVLDKIEKVTKLISSGGLQDKIAGSKFGENLTALTEGVSTKDMQARRKADAFSEKTKEDLINKQARLSRTNIKSIPSFNSIMQTNAGNNKLSIEDQRIEIVLNNNGALPISVDNTQTNNTKSNIDIDTRNFLNR